MILKLRLFDLTEFIVRKNEHGPWFVFHYFSFALSSKSSFKGTEAEFKEFEPRLKFKPRLKYGWFHLKLY